MAQCGMVVKDHSGQVVISACKTFFEIQIVLQVKLRAILFGPEIAHQHGLLVQLVESDCLVAINAIQRGTSSFSPWLCIILDIYLFSAYYGVHKFSYINRDANKLTHKIAKSHSLHGNLSVCQFALPLTLCN
ncbi:hypothetical protein PTKIN_Ptkin01aG0307600 [Pterospermum kingtungense]